MRRLFDRRIPRAWAAAGLAGATCTVVLAPRLDGAARADTAPAGSASKQTLQRLRVLRWAPAGSPLAQRSVGRKPRAVDPVRDALRRMIAAGDRIARLPYSYGGGHGSFDAAGYDCSGSVSYVLHGAGLIATPDDSTDLESFGLPGPGRHVTIYANAEHAWMTIDGRRYDTNALQETGTRWSTSVPSGAGYAVRHPRGF